MYNCKYCGKECKNVNGLHKHERHCKCNPDRIPQADYFHRIDDQTGTCKYCGKFCKNQNSLRNHERVCENNPNRQFTNMNNPEWVQEMQRRARLKPAWNKGLTKETDVRLLEQSKRTKTKYSNGQLVSHQKGKLRTESEKKKISETMKNNPDAGGLRQGSGRGKKGWYNGFFCDSTYELVYVIYNLDNNISFKRCKLKYVYEYKGESHNYYPDFELADGSLVEVKGYFNEQVKGKIDSVKDRKIILLMEKDLDYAFDYVKSHYTYENLEDLYNGIKDGGL